MDDSQLIDTERTENINKNPSWRQKFVSYKKRVFHGCNELNAKTKSWSPCSIHLIVYTIFKPSFHMAFGIDAIVLSDSIDSSNFIETFIQTILTIWTITRKQGILNDLTVPLRSQWTVASTIQEFEHAFMTICRCLTLIAYLFKVLFFINAHSNLNSHVSLVFLLFSVEYIQFEIR